VALPVRRFAFWWVSACSALIFGVLSLAPVDLVAGLLPASSDAPASAGMGELAFGVIGLVLIAPAFVSQLRRLPGAAGVHHVALVVVALTVASVWSGEAVGLLGAAAVGLALGLVGLLHPDRGVLLRQPSPWSPSRLMLGLAGVMSLPAWWYAAVLAARGRADLPPENSFAFVPSVWSALVALLVAISLLAVLATSREGGWTVPAGCVAVAAFLLGLAGMINPHVPGSIGRGWGGAVITWSVVWLTAARASRVSAIRRDERTQHA
jgi:hypothetical protein